MNESDEKQSKQSIDAAKETGLDGKNQKHDNPEQSQRFVETAKELGVDESGEVFERAMDAVKSNVPRSDHRNKAIRRPTS